MESLPLVTVVVPVFNQRERFLRQCIESLIAQDYPRLEIVVSDNRSDNGSWEVINGYRDSRLKAIRPPRHLPMVQHWAFAATQASGEYLSLMGSDDWVEPQWVSTMVAELRSRSSAVFAFCNLVIHKEPGGQERVARDPTIETQLLPAELAISRVVRWTDPLFSWWIAGALIRVEEYFGASGIARYGTVHNGDYPLSLGLLARGDALYVGRALAHYRVWDESQGKADARREAVILEDMVRILAGARTDRAVTNLLDRAGIPLWRVRARFLRLALAWLAPGLHRNALGSEERERIARALSSLFSPVLVPSLMMYPVLHLLTWVFAPVKWCLAKHRAWRASRL